MKTGAQALDYGWAKLDLALMRLRFCPYCFGALPEPFRDYIRAEQARKTDAPRNAAD